MEVTDELLGSGGWAEVKIAKFHGLQVAANCLYQVILSNYNIQQFTREMTIAATLHHPNLLLFIGATGEGNHQPMILTELMPTSLRKKPMEALHHDISSGNVLLEPLHNGW